MIERSSDVFLRLDIQYVLCYRDMSGRNVVAGAKESNHFEMLGKSERVCALDF